MAASVDGRIVVESWHDSTSTAMRRQYEQVHASCDAEGWMCGRTTIEPFAGALRSEAELAREYSVRGRQ